MGEPNDDTKKTKSLSPTKILISMKKIPKLKMRKLKILPMSSINTESAKNQKEKQNKLLSQGKDSLDVYDFDSAEAHESTDVINSKQFRTKNNESLRVKVNISKGKIIKFKNKHQLKKKFTFGVKRKKFSSIKSNTK